MRENYIVELQISPLVQAIRDFKEDTAPSGAGDANYFEPLLECIIIELNRLMKAYQAFDE